MFFLFFNRGSLLFLLVLAPTLTLGHLTKGFQLIMLNKPLHLLNLKLADPILLLPLLQLLLHLLIRIFLFFYRFFPIFYVFSVSFFLLFYFIFDSYFGLLQSFKLFLVDFRGFAFGRRSEPPVLSDFLDH